MKKVKAILLFFVLLSFIIVLRGYDEFHISPFEKEISLSGDNIYECANDTQLSLYIRKYLYVLDKDKKLINVINSVNDGEVFYDVATYNNIGYAVLYSYVNDSGKIESEKIVRLKSDGSIDKTICEILHSEEDRIISPTINKITPEEDKVHFTQIVDNTINVVSVSSNLNAKEQKPEIIFSMHTSEDIMYAVYDSQSDSVYYLNYFGDKYRIDLTKRRIERVYGPLEDTPLYSSYSNITIPISNKFLVKNIIFWISSLILILFAIFLLVRILKSRSLEAKRIPIILGLFVVLCIYIFSNMLIKNIQDSNWKVNGSISLALASSVDVNPFYSQIDKYGSLEEALKDKNFRNATEKYRKTIEELIYLNTTEESLYVYEYYIDKDGKIYTAFDSFKDNYIGQYFGIYSESADYFETILDGNIVYYQEIDDSEFSYSFYGVYREENDEMPVLVFEVGNSIGIARKKAIENVLFGVIHLLAILACLWTFFDCSKSIRYGFERYKELKKNARNNARKRVIAGTELSRVYMFIIVVALTLDYVLLVMVVEDICGNNGFLETAKMLAFPLTVFAIGRFIGSSLCSLVIRWLGERKAAIISSIVGIVVFSLLAYSCYISNIYLLAGAKFFEGIFVESFLYELAVGLPYELDDEANKRSMIVSIMNAEDGGAVIGTLFAGFVVSYFGYASMYLVGAICCTLLLILSGIIFGRFYDEDREEKAKVRPKNSLKDGWLVFTKSISIIYVVMILFVYQILCGYEEFLFPVFAESAGMSDMVLADMSIIASTCAFIGIEKFLPNKNIKPLQLMIYSFVACGAVIALVFFRPSMLFVFIVLVLFDMVSRPIGDYSVLEMTKIAREYGIDEKETCENNFALSDGVKTFQAPIITALLNISAPFACMAIGALGIIFPSIYSLIRKRSG